MPVDILSFVPRFVSQTLVFAVSLPRLDGEERIVTAVAQTVPYNPRVFRVTVTNSERDGDYGVHVRADGTAELQGCLRSDCRLAAQIRVAAKRLARKVGIR